MKNTLSIIFLVLFFGTHSAQVLEIQQTRNAIRSVDAIGTAPGKSAPMVRGFDHSYKGVLGIPYLSKYWEKGMLEGKNGKIYHDVFLRYDMVDDLIQMKTKNGQTSILNKNQILAFRIYSSEETFLTFKVFPEPVLKKKGDPNFFAQVMNDGAIQLLIRRKKYFAPKDNTISPYHTQTNDTFKFRAEKYYILFRGEETPRPLKRNKKSILVIMEKHQDEIKDFIKINLLSMSNDYHLALLIDHYNKLEEEEINN